MLKPFYPKESLMPNELHLAAQDKSGLKIVVQLLKKNPELINQKHSESQMTAIEYAAQSGSIETVQYLLQKGANIDASDGRENIFYWASFNTADVMQYLTNPENQILEKLKDKTTYFHALILEGNEEQVITELVEIPELITQANNKGQTAIFWAYLYKNEAILEFLLNMLAIQMDTNASTYKILALNTYQLSQIERTFNDAISLLEKTIENLKALPSTDKLEMAQINLTFLITFLYIENKNQELGEKYHSKFTELCTEFTMKLKKRLESNKHIPINELEKEIKKIPNRLNAIEELIARLHLARQTIQRGIQCVPKNYDFYNALAAQLKTLNNPTYANINSEALRTMALQHIQKYKKIYQQYLSEGIGFMLDKGIYGLPEMLAIPALSRALKMSFCTFKSKTDEPAIIKQENAKAIIPFAFVQTKEQSGYYVDLKMLPNYKAELSLELEVQSAISDDFFKEAEQIDVCYEKEVIPEETSIISKKSYRINRNNNSILSLHFMGSNPTLPPRNNNAPSNPSTTTTTTTISNEDSFEMKPNF